MDVGISFANSKFDNEYKYMFDIKTPKRIYYLCASTEVDMNRWVDCVCQVCGLKVMTDPDNLYVENISTTTQISLASSTPPLLPQITQHPGSQCTLLDSPPTSPGMNISGPYIHISNCITGERAMTSKFNFNVGNNSQNAITNEDRRSSIPNEMAPPTPGAINNDTVQPLIRPPPTPNKNTGTKPRESFDIPRHLRHPGHSSEDAESMQSPTDGSSVFTDEEWISPPPSGSDAATHHKFFAESSNATLNKEMKSLHINDSSLPENAHTAPPRPPKPAYLTDHPAQTYQNLDTIIKASPIRRNSSSDKSRCSTSEVNHKSRCSASLSSVNNILNIPDSSSNNNSNLTPNSDAEPSIGSVSTSSCSTNTTNPPSTPSADYIYDFPKSHQFQSTNETQNLNNDRSRRHCFNNSVAGTNPTPSAAKVFSYDLQHQEMLEKNTLGVSGDDHPSVSKISPVSGAFLQHQRLKSPYSPPSIDRGLKPKKPLDGVMSGKLQCFFSRIIFFKKIKK